MRCSLAGSAPLAPSRPDAADRPGGLGVLEQVRVDDGKDVIPDGMNLEEYRDLMQRRNTDDEVDCIIN